MKLRKDKKGLLREINEKPKYQRMNTENYELLSVLLDAPKIWENRNKFKKEGQEEYNMCQALREAFEEERSIGWAKGKAEGSSEKTKIFVTNMLRRGMSDEDIMALAECSQEFLNETKCFLTSYL